MTTEETRLRIERDHWRKVAEQRGRALDHALAEQLQLRTSLLELHAAVTELQEARA